MLHIYGYDFKNTIKLLILPTLQVIWAHYYLLHRIQKKQKNQMHTHITNTQE